MGLQKLQTLQFYGLKVIILTIAWIRGLSVEENIIPKKENLVKGKLEKERQQR